MAKKPPHVYLLAAARKIWYWGPQRKAAIAAAMVGKEHIRCAACKKLVPANAKVKNRRLYQVDHIEPVVVPGKKFPTLELEPSIDSCDWDVYLRRLIHGALQVLCLPCHKAKTAKENKERRKK